MPEKCKISKQAYSLWEKMKSKGGTFKAADLKVLYEATVPQGVINELVTLNLIIKDKKGSAYIYSIKAIDPPVEFDIQEESKPAKPAKSKGTPAKSPPAGQKTLEIMAGADKAPTKRSGTPSFADIMEQVGAFCRPYFDQIESLSREVAEMKKILQSMGKGLISPTLGGSQQNVQSVSIQKPSSQIFYDQLTKACKQLDSKNQFGGEIPLPEIWAWFAQQKASITRKDFQDLLLGLEDERKIDLHIANDPSQVRYPENGFSIAGRGLIYYVALRT